MRKSLRKIIKYVNQVSEHLEKPMCIRLSEYYIGSKQSKEIDENSSIAILSIKIKAVQSIEIAAIRYRKYARLDWFGIAGCDISSKFCSRVQS